MDGDSRRGCFLQWTLYLSEPIRPDAAYTPSWCRNSLRQATIVYRTVFGKHRLTLYTHRNPSDFYSHRHKQCRYLFWASHQWHVVRHGRAWRCQRWAHPHVGSKWEMIIPASQVMNSQYGEHTLWNSINALPLYRFTKTTTWIQHMLEVCIAGSWQLHFYMYYVD